MEKEQANILAMRARAEERSQRFLDARSRAIGVDVPYLQSQVEERQQKLAAEKQEEYQRVAQEREILSLLEMREQEEAGIKRAHLNSMKQEWAVQKREIQQKRAHEKMMKDLSIDPDSTGVGALQRFDGEDRERADRLRLQTQQMRDWVAEQKSEHELRKQMEDEEEARHVDYQRMVNNARALLDEEDEKMRQQMVKTIQEENRMKIRENLALRKSQKEAEDYASSSEVAMNMDHPMLTEDMGVSRSMLGPNRIRPCHFKGFSHEERMKFYKENEQILLEKQRMKETQKKLDQDWDLEQERVRNMVERAEVEEKIRQKMMRDQQMAELAQQRREEAAKKEMSNRERFGHIDQQGIYGGFGKSAR